MNVFRIPGPFHSRSIKTSNAHEPRREPARGRPGILDQPHLALQCSALGCLAGLGTSPLGVAGFQLWRARGSQTLKNTVAAQPL